MVALGAGLGVWGVINLLEGYGNDNPGANAYDKEHKDSLSKYPELRERMQNLLQNGEKITPKQWKAEIQSLQAEYNNIGRELMKI